MINRLNKLKNPLFLLLLLSLAFIFTADSFAASRLRILNTRLPVAKQGVSYGVNIYADGGVLFPTGGNYKWCTTTTAPTGICATCTTCTTPLAVSAACDGTGTWQQCSSLTIPGAVTAAASTTTLTFYVMDNDNNIAQKTLSLTINPCVNVVNNTGGPLYYTQNGGACSPTSWNNGAKITISPAIILFQAYSDAACATTCGAITSYSGQKTIDVNNNCTTQATGACAYSDN